MNLQKKGCVIYNNSSGVYPKYFLHVNQKYFVKLPLHKQNVKVMPE